MVGCESCNESEKKVKKDICNLKFGTIKNVIAVISGKGGVGKSTVSGLLATELRKAGYEVGILDADVTGPSIPRFFGVNEKRSLINPEPYTGDAIFEPVITTLGLKIMSLNLLVDKEDDPVIWTSSVVHKVLKQMYTDTKWGDLDYLIIDMPPGTGDVPLTVMQTIPIKGVVMVSIPQDMISMIVSKSINMARKMNIDIFGVIENMSYIKCPDCDKTIKLFNGENTENFLKDMNVELLGELPMHRAITNYGSIELIEEEEEVVELFDPIVEKIIEKSKKKLVL